MESETCYPPCLALVLSACEVVTWKIGGGGLKQRVIKHHMHARLVNSELGNAPMDCPGLACHEYRLSGSSAYHGMCCKCKC